MGMAEEYRKNVLLKRKNNNNSSSSSVSAHGIP